MSKPFGPHWDGSQTQFSVWSPGAEQLELCLFEPNAPLIERSRHEMTKSGGNWSISVGNAPPGTLYGFRATGPYEPARGLRFNSSKLLLDPYARSLVGKLYWTPHVFGYPFGDADSSMPSTLDSAGYVPRSQVIDESFDWDGTSRPNIPLEETVIYEVHLKGLTQLHPEVPPELRGTYAGAAHPAVIDYLKQLGITAIEFLPLHTHVDDAFLLKRGLTNYWGYSTLGFFAPDARYAASQHPGGEVAEFKGMIREYHRAGIEVILDVVYNHTAEGDHQGPTLSFRGLHNAEFYRLSPENKSKYVDLTGTGNTVNAHHPMVTDFILDSLRYWVDVMGVDGFRFDLAPVIGRTEVEFDPQAPLFERMRCDPLLSRVKLFAEPWDLGSGGYQVGNFPDNWSEWNDRYRDVVRSFWRSDSGTLGELGFRLTGSADFYSSRAIGPCASVNFVAAHDGMTTADLIAYHAKRNHANGDNNQDGHDNDVNQFIGPDGVVYGDSEIQRLRRQRACNLIGTLLLSRGVPMILGGDEFGRTQHGNNNAYCQDGPISWLDWTLGRDHDDLVKFVRSSIALRRSEPALRISRFPDDRPDEEDPWIWFVESGALMSEVDWNSPDRRAFGICLDGAPDCRPCRLALLFNAGSEHVTFRLPEGVSQGVTFIELALTSVPGDRDPVVAPPGSLSVLRLRLG